MVTRAESEVGAQRPERGPGRPRRFETTKVLDSALELFWRQGFANTTTRDLESALCLNQSSIYNAFGSKEHLFELVLDRYESITYETLLKPLEDSAQGIESLEQFFIDLYNWVTHGGRRGCMLINMMAEDGGASESISTRTAVYRKRVKLKISKALNRAFKKGEIIEGSLDARTALLFGLALGINIAARGGASDQELKELLNAVQQQIQSWRIAA